MNHGDSSINPFPFRQSVFCLVWQRNPARSTLSAPKRRQQFIGNDRMRYSVGMRHPQVSGNTSTTISAGSAQ